MKRTTSNLFSLILIYLFFSNNILAQNEYPNLDDQSGGIANGYGAWGIHQIIKENSVTVQDKGIITFYHPDESSSKRATVFFISGWGRTAESYDKFFRFIVSHGYCLVNIYNNSDYNNPGYVGNISVSYPNIVDMIKYSSTLFPEWIDTNKIGLMGHSFGGGATIWVGKELFGNKTNWGSEGRFIFTTAPWLSFLVTKEDLQNYPSNVKLHIQVSMDEVVSDDDTSKYTWTTDPRAIRAVFELINIPEEDKDYIRIFSDKNRSYQYNGKTYTYIADHYISYTQAYAYHATYSQYQPYDKMDVYILNRLSHAMMDYVFEGNEAAKDVALGNGSSKQIDNGDLPDLQVTDWPVITRPADKFKYTCRQGWDPNNWKLEMYCEDQDNDGIIDSLENVVDVNKEKVLTVKEFILFQNYPNPFNPTTTIQYSTPPRRSPSQGERASEGFLVSLKVYNILGKEVATLVNENQKPGRYSVTWNATNQPSGIYYYQIIVGNFIETKSMILLK